MLERSIVRAKAIRSVSLLRRKVQWTFRASSAERRLAVRTALHSYTLFGLSGCVVKFSFFTYFLLKIVFVNKIITIVPLLYCSTKQQPPLTRKFTHSCFSVVGVFGVACAVAMMLVFAMNKYSTSAEHNCKTS